MPAASVEINQLTGEEIKRHRVDREITAAQIRLKRSRCDLRIPTWCRIQLRPGRRKIQEQAIQTQLNRSKGRMEQATA